MSQESLSKLMRQADNDEALRGRILEAIGDAGNAAALVALGSELGFEFTEAEANDRLAAYAWVAEHEQTDGELSEADLEAAAGGASFQSLSFSSSSLGRFGQADFTKMVDIVATTPPWQTGGRGR